MSDWGRVTYGDPCGECGFSWSVATSEARAMVAGLPQRLGVLLSGATGHERHPALG